MDNLDAIMAKTDEMAKELTEDTNYPSSYGVYDLLSPIVWFPIVWFLLLVGSVVYLQSKPSPTNYGIVIVPSNTVYTEHHPNFDIMITNHSNKAMSISCKEGK